MNWRKPYISCVLIFAVSIAAQDTRPELLDKFDRVPCSDMRGRVDLFMFELSQDPDVLGFVVLSDDVAFTKALSRRGLFENHFEARKFDMSRVRFVRKPGLSEFGVEFWKVPRSGDLPFAHNSTWDHVVSKGRAPFVAYTRAFNESECLFPPGAGILREFLIANPGSRGNIVIRCNGKRCLREQKQLILSELAEDDDVRSSRIRFFYVPVRDVFSFKIEYWLLP